MNRWTVLACVCLLTLAFPVVTGAQVTQPASREDMEETLEQLQQSLEDARQRLEAIEESQAKMTAPETFRAYWKEGLYFETANKAFKIQVAGRVLNDWTWWNDDSPSEVEVFLEEPLEDGTEFRSARLGMMGTISVSYTHLTLPTNREV